jgi:hypothetical protein
VAVTGSVDPHTEVLINAQHIGAAHHGTDNKRVVISLGIHSDIDLGDEEDDGRLVTHHRNLIGTIRGTQHYGERPVAVGDVEDRNLPTSKHQARERERNSRQEHD